MAIRRRSFDDLGFFPNGKSTQNMGNPVGNLFYFLGMGDLELIIMFYFLRGFLKQVSKFCRFKHPSVLAVEAHNLGGCKTDELVNSQSYVLVI